MRSRQITIFFMLLVAALFLLFLGLRGGLKPAQSTAAQAPRPLVYIFSGIGSGIKSFFGYFASVHGLQKENAVISEQNRNLQQENVALQQYEVENQILKKELAYHQTSKFELIPATVFAADPTGFSQMVIIDAGSSSGIKVGSAVLAQGVLIGTVSSVDSFTSKVLLITDPQSAIPAQIAGTTDNGILRGSYGSGIVLGMTSQEVQVNKGDRVVTTGLNASIPKSILIGQIGEVQSQKNDLLQTASVVSAVDLKNLSFVSVIK